MADTNTWKLKWDEQGKRLYETGVRMGVLYPMNDQGEYKPGVAWNGLTAVNQNPSGAEANKQYADDINYLNLTSAEEFGATIEAFTYPEEFAECDGSNEAATGVYVDQQERKTFGFCYRTVLGNDVLGEGYGYKLHLVYGLKASPSGKNYQTINNSPEAINFSWEVNSTPVNVDGMKPTSVIHIDSTRVDSTKLAALEAKLYGTAGQGGADAELPLPDDVIDMLD